MHLCCSLRQAETSHACLCNYTYGFWTVQLHLWFCTAYRSAVIQHRCTEPSESPMHLCCSLRQAETSLACLCNHTYGFWTVQLHLWFCTAYRSAVIQHRCTEPSESPMHLCCSLRQAETSLACLCNHTYGFWTVQLHLWFCTAYRSAVIQH